MTYADFIAELRRLADQGDSLTGPEFVNHESTAFRDWRHEVESTVSNAEATGFRLPGDFNSVDRPYRALWNGASAADDRKAFNQQMADSVRELRFLIAQFDKFGAPDGGPGVAKPKPPLEAPAQVTLKWLYDHVPWTVWGTFCGLLAATFLAGIKAGQYATVRHWIAAVVAMLGGSSPTPP